MVRLWWLWWPQPARPPPQRWRQAAEHRETPRGVMPPQPDTTWCGCGGCTVSGPPHLARCGGGNVWSTRVANLDKDGGYSDDGDEGVLHVVGCCSWWCGDVVVAAAFSPEKVRVHRENPPEKMEDRRKRWRSPENISGGGAGQWRLPENGEEGERVM
ncbi:hypothetical protein Tco_0466340 [Tanacetum coccineum]